MNQVQIAIILLVVVIVAIILIYYVYQESKFKKMIENNFNQATEDVINNDQGIVFENSSVATRSSFETSIIDKDNLPIQIETQVQKPATVQMSAQAETKLEQKEINFDPLFDNNLSNSAEINPRFAAFDAHNFPFSSQLNSNFDHIIDIYFERAVKIKALPDVSQFTSKSAVYLILEKSGSWSLFERGKKYIATGIKLVVNMVDTDGVISELQLTNIYNELSKFANHHHGMIRQTDSELQIRKIQQQVKALVNIRLDLELFIVNKEAVEFRHLAKYFTSNQFVNNHGVFEMVIDGKLFFEIRDQDGKPLDELSRYSFLSISAKLHHHEDPMLVVNKIFDFAEHYMQYFESRLLTSNKLIMGEKDYLNLEKQVNNYTTTCKRQSILPGSDLILRIAP